MGPPWATVSSSLRTTLGSSPPGNGRAVPVDLEAPIYRRQRLSGGPRVLTRAPARSPHYATCRRGRTRQSTRLYTS